MKARWMFSSIAALVLGLILYVLFCPQAYVSQALYHITGLTVPVIRTRTTGGRTALILIRSFACDVLWAYALTIFVYLAAEPFPRRRAITIGAAVGFEILVELLQLYPGIHATFDVWDIILEVLATIVVVNLIFRHKEEKHEEI